MPFPRPNDTSPIFTKSSFIILILFSCLYVAVRLWRLDAFGLWTDEVFSVYAARFGWGGIIPFVAQDIVHPPLFYLLLKVWIGIGGESLLWLRLLPALTAVATIIPIFLICRELELSATEINTAFLLIATNSYLIYYAQELRMYSLLLFFTLLSLWLFVRIIGGKDNAKFLLPALFLVNLLLIYTQYFGWLVVGVEFVYVLVWRPQRFFSFAIIIAALAICFAPWVYAVSRAASEKHGLGENLSWLSRPGLADLVWYYATLHGSFEVHRTTTLGIVIFGCPLLLWSWRVLGGAERKVRRIAFWILILSSFLPVIFVFAASQILSESIWGERYLIIAAVPYLILVAVATNRLPYAWGRVIVTSLIISWAAVSNLFALTRDDRKLHWDTLAHTMMKVESGQAKSVRIYTFENFVASPLRFFLESSGERRFDVVVVKDITELHEAHFWVAFRNTTWNAESLPQTILRDVGCRVGQESYVSDRAQRITLFPTECDK